MYKNTTEKIRALFKKQWFYHVCIGIVFLFYAMTVIVGNGIFLNDAIKVLGFLFFLTGIGNLIYSFSGIGITNFHWGEIFFWGSIEIFSGWLILSNKLLKLEGTLISDLTSTIEKVTGSRINLQGYLIIFFVGTFLTVRGISHIVTKIYDLDEREENKILNVIRRILILDGFVDFVFGIGIILSMYLIPSIFLNLVFLYIILASILMIIFGLGTKYSIKDDKKNDKKETSLQE